MSVDKGFYVNCQECGESIRTTPGRYYTNGSDRYCSPDCRQALNKVTTDSDVSYVELTTRKRIHVAYAIVDTASLDRMFSLGRRWYPNWSPATSSYRAWVKTGDNPLELSRFLVNASPEAEIDHISGDTLDYRLANLRAVTRHQNMQNRKGAASNSGSGIRGVRWHTLMHKWEARVFVNRKCVYSEFFHDIEDAEQAAIAARKRYMTHSTY